MFKITGKFEATNELEKEIEQAFNQAVKDTIAKTTEKVKDYARANMEKGYDKWEKGFSLDEIAPGEFILSVSGQVAKVLEDGWRRGEISDMLRSGSRYKYNQSVGKEYVDVPLDAPNNAKARFVDADGLMNQFQKKKVKFSDPKRTPPIREEDRYIRRVKEVIESKKKLDSNSRFMTIRRVGKNTVWPANPKPGVKALEKGAKDLERDFEEILKRLL